MGYVGPEVPDMGIVVNREAAAVKTGFAGDNGFKGLHFAAQGIVLVPCQVNLGYFANKFSNMENK